MRGVADYSRLIAAVGDVGNNVTRRGFDIKRFAARFGLQLFRKRGERRRYIIRVRTRNGEYRFAGATSAYFLLGVLYFAQNFFPCFNEQFTVGRELDSLRVAVEYSYTQLFFELFDGS